MGSEEFNITLLDKWERTKNEKARVLKRYQNSILKCVLEKTEDSKWWPGVLFT